MPPSEPIVFTVPCVPVAQPRQRHRVVAAKGRMFVQNYTPARDPVNAFKAAVQQAAEAAYQGPPLRCPILLACLFVMPRPQIMMWRKRPMPRAPHTSRPDVDNLLKSVKDALSKLTWADDSQVCDVRASKVVAAGDEQPHVHVEISAVENSDLPPNPDTKGLF